MNERNDITDDAMIDRLVDGELSGDERRELLASFDVQPDGWRRCALAFLEAQTWRSQMRQIVAPNAISPVSRDASAATLESSRPSKRYGGAWLAAAAALLVAFGLGRQLGVGERAELNQTQIASVEQATPRLPVDLKPQDRPTGDAVTLVVNDHRGVPQRVSVPLVEGRRLGAHFSDTPHWSSPELERRLDAQGLTFAAHRRYAPMYFEQQNQKIPFIVPVDDAVVTPVSRPVY
jgi:hypothetical protein